MNKENAERLIATLKENEGYFDMTSFVYHEDYEWALLDCMPIDRIINDCGTTACIAGWAALISGEKEGHIETVAQQWLDLNRDDAYWLFYGKFSYGAMAGIEVDEAIKAVEWLMAGNKSTNEREQYIVLEDE
jgi:hypothetical protein